MGRTDVIREIVTLRKFRDRANKDWKNTPIQHEFSRGVYAGKAVGYHLAAIWLFRAYKDSVRRERY